MNKSIHKVGIIFAILFGVWHVIWSWFVLVNVGQAIVDFVFWAHMVHVQYVVGPFEFTAFLTLIVFTSVVGYVVGCISAIVWNKIHSNTE